MYTVRVSRQFDAAHYLRDYEGKCAQLHGHTWTVVLYLKKRELDSAGISVDFQEVKNHLDPLVAQIDHTLLNDKEPFSSRLNPSAENIARWFYDSLSPSLPDLKQVEIYETPSCSVTYDEDQ